MTTFVSKITIVKGQLARYIMLILCSTLSLCFGVSAQEVVKVKVDTTKVKPSENLRRNRTQVEIKDRKATDEDKKFVRVVDQAGDTVNVTANDSIEKMLSSVEILEMQKQLKKDSIEMAHYGKIKVFRPDPNRALWLSALCPGLGQVYNRRYWKLPIVVGGFAGLAYATSWNNRMLKDYSKAYSDATDSDPNTKSYMDLYPPTTREEDIDMNYLIRQLKSKKDFFRRNRDLCIIGVVGMYLLCMVDAYVDASLSKFDISPDLSMRVRPAVIEQPAVSKLPGVGVQCALTF